jgi:4'-phosphopantetheinyl transferase
MDGLSPGALPDSGEVRVAAVLLDRSDADVLQDEALLSPAERSRADRFRFRRDRARFVVGRGALRRLLGRYLSRAPAEVDIQAGRLGKPELMGSSAASGLRFNLAHSDGLALYAFTRDREVGIDVEAVRTVPEARAVAGQFFSALEVARLAGLSRAGFEEAFLNGWTRKEAFLKARGDGLHFPLDRFHVSMAPGEPARLLGVDGEPAAVREWSIADVPTAPGFVAAVAARGPIDRLTREAAPRLVSA